jgi:cobalt/nickel transport system permease protein
MLLALALLSSVLAAGRIEALLVLHATAWILVASSGLPWTLMAAAAAYPVFVTLLFLIATWGAPWQIQLSMMLRPVTVVLVALWIVGTTPYPDVLAPISRLLPRSIADGLFLTYRALFDLLERAERMGRWLRVRGGGDAPIGARLALTGQGLATLVLYGLERSQRLYAAMLLRGHSGRVCGCRHFAEYSPADAWVIAVGLVSATAVYLTGGLW